LAGRQLYLLSGIASASCSSLVSASLIHTIMSPFVPVGMSSARSADTLMAGARSAAARAATRTNESLGMIFLRDSDPRNNGTNAARGGTGGILPQARVAGRGF